MTEMLDRAEIDAVEEARPATTCREAEDVGRIVDR
jgi:hypothetical protein